jgi:hypothetical protein
MIEAIAPIIVILFVGVFVAVVMTLIAQQSKDSQSGGSQTKGFFKGLLDDINLMFSSSKDTQKSHTPDPEGEKDSQSKVKFEFSKTHKTKSEKETKSEYAKFKAELKQQKQEKANVKFAPEIVEEPEENTDIVELLEADNDILKKLVIGDIIMTPRCKKRNYRNFLN